MYYGFVSFRRKKPTKLTALFRKECGRREYQLL